jgi:hypothetical protein
MQKMVLERVDALIVGLVDAWASNLLHAKDGFRTGPVSRGP